MAEQTGPGQALSAQASAGFLCLGAGRGLPEGAHRDTRQTCQLYDPRCCLALSGLGPPASRALLGSQVCQKLPSGKGEEARAISSPGQGRNQISWPGLLLFSLSLVSLELFHRAGFTQSLKSPLTWYSS